MATPQFTQALFSSQSFPKTLHAVDIFLSSVRTKKYYIKMENTTSLSLQVCKSMDLQAYEIIYFTLQPKYESVEE